MRGPGPYPGDDRWLQTARAGLLAGILVVVAAAVAGAHPILVQSAPASGGTVSSPDRLVLRFNSRIEKTLSSVTLNGGRQDGPRVLSLPEPATPPEVLVFRLPALAPGRYEARWKVLAADGHVGQGVVSFTVTVAPAGQ